MKGYKPVIKKDSGELVVNPFKNSMTVKPESGVKRQTIRERYDSLKAKREPALSRAKSYAKLTLPALFSDSESTDQGESYNQHGWQSLGSTCTNHLSNKLVMTWFPPQRSFFRLKFTDEAKAALYEAGVDDVELMTIMSRAEEKARSLHEEIQGRIAWTQAAKHLIVAGNAMLYAPSNDTLIAYPLDRYVVKRSKSGKILELIIEEEKSLSEFPPAIQAVIKAQRMHVKQQDNEKLYTRAKWSGEEQKYIIEQEVADTIVGQTYRVTADNLPFIVMVWDRLYGEDYGRGMVEDNAGDLFVYQFLSKASAKGCALMSEVKFLVRRGSATSPEQHAAAETGEYVWGDEGDITVVELGKYGDFQMVSQVMEIYAKRLGNAFLLASANRRDAERVTAYELRQDAQELETTLGGTYSQIAVSGQMPYAKMLLRRSGFKLPATDAVPAIVTGIEALGKAGELDKVMQMSEMLSVPATWPPEMQARMKWSDYTSMIAANLNMEIPWLMTEEEYAEFAAKQQQAAQQQAMQEAAMKVAPAMMKGAE